jgi:catechol 2,3-dioxygenase-like lactoylglutathione lyase family enzyme
MKDIPIITGIDHIYISVSDMVESEKFYDLIMSALGFKKNSFEIDRERHVQYYCRHFGFVIRPSNCILTHDPYSPGLHHLCLRVDSQTDVFECAKRLESLHINITPPSNYPEYAPDYYAFTFKDPDGIRLEVTNYRQERRARHDSWREGPFQ